MSQERMEEPKNLGEALEVYKKFGFKDGAIGLNAIILVRMHNMHLAELTKEREANKKLREGLEWYADAKTWKLGVTITMGSAHPHHEPIKEDQGKRARSILEGNEPNEGNNNPSTMGDTDSAR